MCLFLPIKKIFGKQRREKNAGSEKTNLRQLARAVSYAGIIRIRFPGFKAPLPCLSRETPSTPFSVVAESFVTLSPQTKPLLCLGKKEQRRRSMGLCSARAHDLSALF